MKRKKSVVPEIKIPMHLQGESIEIKLRDRDLLDNYDVKGIYRGLKEIDNHIQVLQNKRQAILEDESLSEIGKKEAFKQFVAKYDSKSISSSHGMSEPISHYITHTKEALDNKEREIKELQERDIKKGVRQEIAKDIREHCANLPDKRKRMSFLKKRVDEGDWMSCSALFNDIPHYLLGIDKETLEEWSKYHVKKRFPDHAVLNEGYSKIREGLGARVRKLKELKKELGIKDS